MAFHNVNTVQGQLVLQIQEHGRDLQNREIPIINVRCGILPGNVNDPAILFRESFRRAYQFARQTLHINNQNANRATVRMSIEARGIHATDWGSPTILIRNINQTINALIDAWENYLISEPDVNLSQGALTIYYQFVFDLHHPLPNVPELVGGIKRRNYQNVKERMWCPISKLDYYIHGKGLLEIPITDTKLCFIMAFITCQCRYLIKNKDHKIDNILESEGVIDGTNIHSLPYQFIPCVDENLQIQLDSYLPQYINSKKEIILFNPFKYQANIRGTYLKTWLNTPQKLNTFILLAKYIHQYVEKYLNRPVVFTHLQEVAQAYADVFQVYIHIRRFQLRGKQSMVYFPSVYPLNESHIIIMINNDDENEYAHADAVTHIRDFTKSKQSAKSCNISSYCDYCQKITSCNNTNKQKDFKHINECRESFLQFRGNKIEYQFNQQRQQFYWDKSIDCYKCCLCYTPVENFNNHQCYAPYKPIQVPMDENKLFVFDIEARQDLWKQEEFSKKFLHTVDLVCIRSVYSEDYSQQFPSIDLFLIELLSNKRFHGATILAHNGGSYDCQFILQYLEKNNIPFKNIPRPGSLHKYIQLEIIQKNSNPLTPGYDSIIFKDFMMFIPGSLRNIALAFKCNLTKGDFPHRFNKIENQNYIGAIPPMDTEDDYYSLKYCKDTSQKQELVDWYNEQTMIYCTCPTICQCNKQKWNFQEQLATYCWLDVNVLAECVRKFRDAHLLFGQEESMIYNWIPNPIDPFVYCTQSQVAMNLFLGGHSEINQPAVSPIKYRTGWSKISIEWLEHISKQERLFIQHYGNSDREYYDKYTKRFVDGYCPLTNTIYQFHGCYFHGCLHCFCPTEYHPQKNISYQQLYDKTIETTNKLQHHYEVITIWECEWKQLKHHLHLNTNYYLDCANIITDREFLHGGRTEVFSPYANITNEDSIQYHDVCSLYPTVCALDELPIGHPKRYFSHKAQEFYNHNKVFGYIRCKVMCPSNDRIGLLPHKNEDTNRLTFDLLEKKGTFFANELYFAMQYGYKVVEIYEILHFPESSRSDTYMRGYMAYFYRMKEESEGFKDNISSESSIEEKNQFIELIHQETPQMLPMRLLKIQKSPVFRQLAKIYLNCLWGKFGQSSEQEHKDYIYGYNEFLKYQFNSEIDKSSIRYRHVSGEGYQVIYKNTKDYYRRNNRYNAWIAAAVTSHARIRLHTQMMKIGPERILYCDTDSIFFLYPKSELTLAARGLGRWVDEIFKDYGNSVFITKFLGLSPKNYCYLLSNGEYILKAKGVKMTIKNKEKCNPETLEKMIQYKLIEGLPGYEEPEILLLDHFSIYSNSINHELAYGSMLTLETQKQMKIVLSKRLLKQYFTEIPVNYLENFPLSVFQKIDTFPIGYK